MLSIDRGLKTRDTLAIIYCIANNDMSSVNAQSVREEAERIKAEFNRIAANKKVDAEINMLIQSMLMLINFAHCYLS